MTVRIVTGSAEGADPPPDDESDEAPDDVFDDAFEDEPPALPELDELSPLPVPHAVRTSSMQTISAMRRFARFIVNTP
jgi:hypothetical protein